MAKRVRKKTKAELASPKFRDRSKHQAAVLMDAYHACDKLSKKRHQFILDIADNHWVNRPENMDDHNAMIAKRGHGTNCEPHSSATLPRHSNSIASLATGTPDVV